MKIVKAVQTCVACPSRWDAWTDTGQYLYLRYRFGTGTVRAFDSEGERIWNYTDVIISFSHGDSYDGSIELEKFCELAGLELEL